MPKHIHRPVYEAGNTYCGDCMIWLYAGRPVPSISTDGATITVDYVRMRPSDAEKENG